MPNEDTQEDSQALGAFLRNHREQKGVSLADVSETTKISLPVLKAIEEDDHEKMPAEAFCRGFYALYADFLGLNQTEILERYAGSSTLIHKNDKKQAKPPIRMSQTFSNYAEASSISPGTSITLFSAICLIIIAVICYYFQWNPIDYITAKLTPAQTAVEQQQSQTITENETIAVSPETQPLAILPDSDDEKTHQVSDPATTQETTVAPYHLEATFNDSGTLKVTLDDGFVLDKHFTAGETLQWEVKKKIILDMPETISGDLRLNGIEIPLPQEENGRRILSLPEDFLD